MRVPFLRLRRAGRLPARAACAGSAVCLGFFFLLAVVPCAPAQQDPRPDPDTVLITGGRVVTMAGLDLEPGDVLISKGKIAAVGRNLKGPRGVRVIDAAGKTIIPGLIDAYSGLLRDESAGRAEAASRAADGIDLFRPREIDSALAQGVTAAAIFPAALYGVSGRAIVLRLAPGRPLADLIIADDAALKAAIGHGPYGRALGRLGEAKQLREALKKAREYAEALETYADELKEYVKKLEERAAEEDKAKKKDGDKENADKKDPDKKEGEKKEGEKTNDAGGPGGTAPRNRGGGEGEKEPEKRPGEDANGKDDKKKDEIKKPEKPKFDAESVELLDVLNGKRPLFVEAHRAADILNVLDIAAEYPVRLVLAGCTEGGLVAGAIAKSGASVVLGPPVRPFTLENNEFRNQDPGCAAALDRAGVPVVLAGSGRTAPESLYLTLYAAEAAAAGLDRRKALEAVTIAPARLLGVADRIGSLEKGKDADVVVFSGDPLSSAAAVDLVLVKGEVVYDRQE